VGCVRIGPWQGRSFGCCEFGLDRVFGVPLAGLCDGGLVARRGAGAGVGWGFFFCLVFVFVVF